MPIYDYVCSSCTTRTEFIHGIDAPAPRFCPSCGAEDTLRKAFVAPSVHFKGSGWAKKDRSGASPKTKAAAASGGDGASSDASGHGESTSSSDSSATKKGSDASSAKSAQSSSSSSSSSDN